MSVDSCFEQLDDLQRWVLAELYGLTCFDPRQRSLASACAKARDAFPERFPTIQSARRHYHDAMRRLRRTLAQIEMIPRPCRHSRAGAIDRDRGVRGYLGRHRQSFASNHH